MADKMMIYTGLDVKGPVTSDANGILIGAVMDMPEASALNAGCTVLFMGNSGTYEKGAIYLCTQSGETFQWVQDTTVTTVIQNYVTSRVPTKLSAFTNDSGFVTATVDNLTNYYLKTETYTRDEIDNKISAIPKFDVEVVTTLPTANISESTIYLRKNDTTGDSLYDEFIYVNGTWELLGTARVDLSDYSKLADTVKSISISGTTVIITYGNGTTATQTISNAVHATTADSATKATQDGNGKVIADTYATATALTDGLAGKVDKVTGKGLSANDYTDAEKTKLAGIAAGAQVNAVTSVAGRTGAVTLSKSDVGLGNVLNVASYAKTETYSQTEIDNKLSGLGKGTLTYARNKVTSTATGQITVTVSCGITTTASNCEVDVFINGLLAETDEYTVTYGATVTVKTATSFASGQTVSAIVRWVA